MLALLWAGTLPDLLAYVVHRISEEFQNNFVDMRKVTDYSATDTAFIYLSGRWIGVLLGTMMI